MRANKKARTEKKNEKRLGRGFFAPSLPSLLTFVVRWHRSFLCSSPYFLNAWNRLASSNSNHSPPPSFPHNNQPSSFPTCSNNQNRLCKLRNKTFPICKVTRRRNKQRLYQGCLLYLSGVTDTPTPGEPPIKRRRMARAFSEGEWDSGSASENSTSCETEHKVYTAELIVFDNNKHCLLTDGEYELALSEKHKKPGRKKGILSNRTSWENVFEGQASRASSQSRVYRFSVTAKQSVSFYIGSRPNARPLKSKSGASEKLKARLGRTFSLTRENPRSKRFAPREFAFSAIRFCRS